MLVILWLLLITFYYVLRLVSTSYNVVSFKSRWFNKWNPASKVISTITFWWFNKCLGNSCLTLFAKCWIYKIMVDKGLFSKSLENHSLLTIKIRIKTRIIMHCHLSWFSVYSLLEQIIMNSTMIAYVTYDKREEIIHLNQVLEVANFDKYNKESQIFKKHFLISISVLFFLISWFVNQRVIISCIHNLRRRTTWIRNDSEASMPNHNWNICLIFYMPSIRSTFLGKIVFFQEKSRKGYP